MIPTTPNGTRTWRSSRPLAQRRAADDLADRVGQRRRRRAARRPSPRPGPRRARSRSTQRRRRCRPRAAALDVRRRWPRATSPVRGRPGRRPSRAARRPCAAPGGQRQLVARPRARARTAPRRAGHGSVMAARVGRATASERQRCHVVEVDDHVVLHAAGAGRSPARGPRGRRPPSAAGRPTRGARSTPAARARPRRAGCRPPPSTGSRRARRRTSGSAGTGRWSLSRRSALRTISGSTSSPATVTVTCHSRASSLNDVTPRRSRGAPSPPVSVPSPDASGAPCQSCRPVQRVRPEYSGDSRDSVAAHRAGSSTRSSRCTTSRSYGGAELAGQVAGGAAEQAGQLVGVVVDQPAGDRHAVGVDQVDRVPADERAARPPVIPAGSSDARRSDDRADRAGVEHEPALAARWRAPARAAGSAGGARWGGTACRPGSPASAAAACAGRGEHDRDAGAGGDPGRLDLGLHAAGADPGRARRCRRCTAARSAVGAHLGEQRGAAGRRGSPS